MAKELDRSDKLLIEEYQQANEHIRYYGNLQFAVLSVYLVIFAALLAVIFDAGVSLSATLQLSVPGLSFAFLLKSIALLTTCLFWIVELRALALNGSAYTRALEIEKELKFSLYLRAPPSRILRASVAMRLIYIVFVLFWLASFFL